MRSPAPPAPEPRCAASRCSGRGRESARQSRPWCGAPVAEVFDAVYNPSKLSGYFTTGGASAPLVEGSTVTWDFADFPGAFPVQVRRVEQDRLIELEWKAGDGDYSTRIRLEFEPLEGGATLVRISEGTWRETQQGLDASYGNCMGWTQMLCAMKLYVERGINLRQDFF